MAHRENPLEEHKKVSKLLSKNLSRECLSTRSGFSGSKLIYIEGWQAIEIANKIFGYDGWTSHIYDMKEEYRDITEDKFNKSYSVAYTCTCKVTLTNGMFHEDIGFGSADGLKMLGKAIEKAKKGAVTDALKRALRQFGNALGNCCYNKSFIKAAMNSKSGNNNLLQKSDLAYRYSNEAASLSFDNDLLEFNDSPLNETDL